MLTKMKQQSSFMIQNAWSYINDASYTPNSTADENDCSCNGFPRLKSIATYLISPTRSFLFQEILDKTKLHCEINSVQHSIVKLGVFAIYVRRSLMQDFKLRRIKFQFIADYFTKSETFCHELFVVSRLSISI